MLIKLSCNCYVAADEVAEVKVNSHSGSLIIVRMRDGVGHSVSPEYGESVYQCVDRLVKMINEAMTK